MGDEEKTGPFGQEEPVQTDNGLHEGDEIEEEPQPLPEDEEVE